MAEATRLRRPATLVVEAAGTSAVVVISVVAAILVAVTLAVAAIPADMHQIGVTLDSECIYVDSVKASVCLLIFAVRSSLSQLKGLPSMARLRVLNSTIEKTWR